MKWLIIFVAILIYRFIINFVHFWKCKGFLKRYYNYLADGKDWDFTQNQDEIIDLFKKAGIKDASAPYWDRVGYGHVSKGTMSIFQNLNLRREDVIQNVLIMFHRAIGVFSKRARQTFSPLFWIEIIFNLPKALLKYLGVPAESIVIKIIQIIYWISCSVISFFIMLFKS